MCVYTDSGHTLILRLHNSLFYPICTIFTVPLHTIYLITVFAVHTLCTVIYLTLFTLVIVVFKVFFYDYFS